MPRTGPDPRTLPASGLIANTLYGKMAFVVAVEQARSAQAGRDNERSILTEMESVRSRPPTTASGAVREPSSKSSP